MRCISFGADPYRTINMWKWKKKKPEFSSCVNGICSFDTLGYIDFHIKYVIFSGLSSAIFIVCLYEITVFCIFSILPIKSPFEYSFKCQIGQGHSLLLLKSINNTFISHTINPWMSYFVYGKIFDFSLLNDSCEFVFSCKFNRLMIAEQTNAHDKHIQWTLEKKKVNRYTDFTSI